MIVAKVVLYAMLIDELSLNGGVTSEVFIRSNIQRHVIPLIC